MKPAIDLVGSRRWLFALSGVVIVVSLVLLAIPPSLRPGIEFTSGTTALLRFEGDVQQAELRDAYAALDHPEARIQSTGDREFLIRTSELDIPATAFVEVAPTPALPQVGPTPVPTIGTVTLGAAGAGGEVALFDATIGPGLCQLSETEVSRVASGTEARVLERIEACEDAGPVLRVSVGTDVAYVPEAETRDFVPVEAPAGPSEAAAEGNERVRIERELESRFGAFETLEFAQVSPVVSRVAVRNATVAVAVASLFIMAYVAFAFSSVPRPFLYAGCAIAALAHDVTIVLGAFSLFGKVFATEINLMFVTGLLTVIGFSVHDSIVVFDRIRENITLHPTRALAENVNSALLQTLARSFNTSLTVLLTVGALLLLGGSTIREFLLVILVGVVAGTYSSIAIAAQLLVAYEEGDLARLWARLRGRRREQPQTA